MAAGTKPATNSVSVKCIFEISLMEFLLMFKGKAGCQRSSKVFFGHAGEMQKHTSQSKAEILLMYVEVSLNFYR